MKLNIILLVIVILLIIYYCHKKYNEMEGYWARTDAKKCGPILAGHGHCGRHDELQLTYQQFADKWCKLKGEGDKASSFTYPDGSYVDPNSKQLPRGFGSGNICWIGGPDGHKLNTRDARIGPYDGAVARKSGYGIGRPCKAISNLKCGPKMRVDPTQKCPNEWEQVGSIGADIGGCGMDSCSARYNKKNIQECANWCRQDRRCKAFNWAPYNGDKNHKDKRVCTRYTSEKPNQMWKAGDGSYKQTLCKPKIKLVQTETTNDFWKGAYACGCDWTNKHIANNFDNDAVRKGNFKWCWAPNSKSYAAKHNCENRTKFSMCKLNSKGHCVTRFQFQKNAPKGFTNQSIIARHSKLCLEAPTRGQITQQICTGDANQQFSYNPRTYELKSRAGYCVDIKGGSRGDRAGIQTYPCKQNTDNQFNQRFYQVGNTFKPMHIFQNITSKPQDNNSGKCIDILGGKTTLGANLIQYRCHGGANQQFDVIDPAKVKQSFSEPHAGDAIKGFNGMLNAQKYKGYWADNLNFFNTAPKIGNVKQLKTIHLLDEGEYYSYKIWGFFSPPKTGKYYFKTNSDDASVVYIDKTKVVDNGQPHGMRARTGAIDLQKGKIYPIFIYFGERGGYAELYFWWSSGQGWTNSLAKFYSSKTYDDVPCAANFTGQQFKVSKWGAMHKNGTEELHTKSGVKFNIFNKDVDKIKGALDFMVYSKQPPGGTFFADPIKTRDIDFYGNLTLKTHMNTSGIIISNNNRKCFDKSSHIYVGTKLPDPPANCNKQVLYSGQYMCVECKPGYQLSQNKRNCNLIPIENCKEQKGLECKKCHDGSFLSENRRKCIKAAPPPPAPPPLEKVEPDNRPGLRGQRGDLGERGIRGPLGKRGPKGKNAPKRAANNKGLKGPPGVGGPKGPKGLRGPKGWLGARGIHGYQGKETVTDPWADPKIVSQLMVVQDKLKDKNKKLGYNLDSDRKPVDLTISMPRNRKKAVFKRFLVEASDDPDDDIKKIEGMSTYPPGRGPENLPNMLNAFNKNGYFK